MCPSDRSMCLTEAEWARLLSKRCDAAERARAAEHIGSCAQCADEYRLLQPLQCVGRGRRARALTRRRGTHRAAGPHGARGGRRLASRSR